MRDKTPEEELRILRELILTMIRALVDNEDAVTCTELVGQHNVIFEVTVADSDMGLAIGQGGAHAKAIRLILNAACKKANIKYYFEILSQSGTQKVTSEHWR